MTAQILPLDRVAGDHIDHIDCWPKIADETLSLGSIHVSYSRRKGIFLPFMIPRREMFSVPSRKEPLTSLA